MRIRSYFILLVILGILFFFAAQYYSKRHYDMVKKSPQKFPYETYWGVPNPVLFIKDLKYEQEYLTYYKGVKKKETPTVKFPVIDLPSNKPIYIIGYSKDSLLAKFVSLYDRGKYFGGSYTEGYIILDALHDNPPTLK